MATAYTQLVSTVPMDVIMKTWLADYTLNNPKQEIIFKDWYYDPTKGTVVVVINIKEET